jgi:hypothetical protein
VRKLCGKVTASFYHEKGTGIALLCRPFDMSAQAMLTVNALKAFSIELIIQFYFVG